MSLEQLQDDDKNEYIYSLKYLGLHHFNKEFDQFLKYGRIFPLTKKGVKMKTRSNGQTKTTLRMSDSNLRRIILNTNIKESQELSSVNSNYSLLPAMTFDQV